jgi:protein-L-isoaspartate(D-aspartate) O-methyltransferase
MMRDEQVGSLILELRQYGITDAAVLNAIERLPRDMFLADHFKSRAYENVALPIGHHQTVSQPLVVAMMTQALELTDRSKVLEIGTGSGYQTSVLSPLCRRVYTIERHKPLLQEAEERFTKLNIRNVTAMLGDGSSGWPEQAPFERIIVTAAAIDVPPLLFDQLSVGGIMVIPVGVDENDQRLTKIVKTESGADTTDLGGVRFVPLVAGAT